MHKDDLTDLHAFAIIAEEASFTRAAARLNMSSSALSHAIKRLEERLGIRLLVRTTRSVAPSAAGSQLLTRLAPALQDIELGLNLVSDLKSKPSGTIRITAGEHACETVLWPALRDWLPRYPDVDVEISVDPRLTDVVGERFDAGVRIGEAVDRDMVAVRIGPELKLIVVAAPAYFERARRPETPADLASHRSVNLRLPTTGRVYAWEFERKGEKQRVTPPGQLIFDSARLALRAALDGAGLAMVMADEAAPYLARGELQQALGDWVAPFAG
jgi:DNA-binding transcriptional LysR family regulator